MMVSAKEQAAAHTYQSGHQSVEGAHSAPLPDLEIVDVPRQSSFKAWSHGYPFRTVRWHFHPEYEIHLVTQTTGRSFIGDYIGAFEPGNLVMTGPNLPHNWISDVESGQVIDQRCMVVQFTEQFIDACAATMPEFRAFLPMFEEAAAGIEFAEGAGNMVRPFIEALIHSEGPERLTHFFGLLNALHTSNWRRLSSNSYEPKPESYIADPINHVIDHIARNLSEDFRQTELATLCGFSPSAFSRAFKQQTGLTFVRYVNDLRIRRACELLVSTDDSITDICFNVGFGNLSNFNRRFLALKGISPSRFRNESRRYMASRVQWKDSSGAKSANLVRSTLTGAAHG